MSETIKLSIEGMSCQGCVRAVTKALERVEGVSEARVSLDEHAATVQGQADPEALVAAVRKAGYEASVADG